MNKTNEQFLTMINDIKKDDWFTYLGMSSIPTGTCLYARMNSPDYLYSANDVYALKIKDGTGRCIIHKTDLTSYVCLGNIETSNKINAESLVINEPEAKSAGLAPYTETKFLTMMGKIKKGDTFVYLGNIQLPRNTVMVAETDNPTYLRGFVKYDDILNLRKYKAGEYIAIQYTELIRYDRNDSALICALEEHFALVAEGKLAVNEPVVVESAQVESDGLSSSYYNLPFNQRLTAKIMAQIDSGEALNIETGDVIELAFGNDFDFGNIIKALKRIHEAKNGRGKKGVDAAYDLNKCKYFIDEIKNKL